MVLGALLSVFSFSNICEGGHFKTAAQLEELRGCTSVKFLKIAYAQDIHHMDTLVNLTYIEGELMLRRSRTADLSGLANLK